jgi:hypothetical protein
MTLSAWRERKRTVDDYVIDGNLVFSDQSSALKFYREQYHKKKEWQGLTDREVLDAWLTHRDTSEATDGFARAIETKLKEKNT